ncbi:MAG: ECF transporter S component [Promethearchaeota archaeon]
MQKIKEFLKTNEKTIGITVGTLFYPLLSFIVKYIPNPMVPGAIIALNMIFPVLTGYFYGWKSGTVAGAVGTAISAFIRNSIWDALAIFPHALMGYTAGLIYSKFHSDLATSLSIFVGHFFNILFYIRFGLLTIATADIGITILGILTEAMLDIIAIVLVMNLLKKCLLHTDKETRW